MLHSSAFQQNGQFIGPKNISGSSIHTSTAFHNVLSEGRGSEVANLNPIGTFT